ncbi:MAG: hypothetical protein AVDCRST_MAG91-3786 [uncultured Sphingomonadaceae bacterium]|uniref:Uncharacterized protein n=1 Tax=uncultured Sphingomonadaceae bacterium TaxID=169976 RepID=A0A6J4U4H0_9SPHN|nr:MAG: hypothetical protein AVDCRST_MAG91-3786 [uncultured Sphingomonadaceae bacterium]
MLIGSIGERTACLIDGNADGIFDSHFGNKVQFEGFPIVRGKYPKKPGALQSLPYKETDPAVLSGSYTIAIQYRGDANLSGKHMFRTTFSGPKDKSALSQWTAIPGKGLPREASIMGSRFTILEELGPQVRLRVDRTMPEQPFQVIRTFSYR